MVQQHHQRVLMDELATDAGQECEEIGQRLKSEVHRIAHTRRGEWSASVKIVASAMKEALTERVAIWETVQENFLQAFPAYKTAAASQPPMAQPQIPQQQMPPMAQQQQHQMEQPPVVRP